MTGQVDSKFGFGLASGDAALAVARIGGSPAFELVGVHAHIGSQIFLLHSFEKAVEVLADFVAPLGLPELCLGGGLGVAYVDGEDAPTIAEWAKVLQEACLAAGIASRVTAEPGGPSPPPPASPSTGWARSRTSPACAPTSSVDGGHERQPPARALRQRLRGLPAPGHRRRPAADGHRGRQALRVGRRRRARRPACRPTWPWATSCAPRSPAPTATPWPPTTTRCPRPAVVFVRDGEARVVVRRETLDDLLRLDQ